MAKPLVKTTAANDTGQAWRPAAPRPGPWWANILLVDDDEAFSYAAFKKPWPEALQVAARR
jgi:hypothetical protein